MDNPVFNVNGKGRDLLIKTLALAFEQRQIRAPFGFKIDLEKGIVLFWAQHVEATPFLGTPTIEALADMLLSELEATIWVGLPFENWDADPDDHDVKTDKGWRAYTEDWGHAGGHHTAFLIVRPVFLWYGK